MGGLLTPTSSAQINGHRFLQRRVAHGIVMGDIRMIHEPLSTRRRGLIFGGIAGGLGCLIAGAIALFAPQPNPGTAPLVRAEDGTHYVLIDDTYHQALNLTSAHLALGENTPAARISDSILAQHRKGVPIGIADAPALPLGDAHSLTLAACHHAHRTTVTASPATPPLPEGHALYAHTDTGDWIITAQGRQALPPQDSPEGRAIRRAVGIHPHTPTWLPPHNVLDATPTQPAATIPPIHTQVTLNATSYALGEEGLIALTPTQARILTEVGIPTRPAHPGEAARINDNPRQPLPLPATPLVFIDPHTHLVCAQGTHGTPTARDLDDNPGVELPATHGATRYRGPGHPLVADTGGGLVLISDSGIAHPIAGAEAAAALGARPDTAASASAAITNLLPQGPTLERQAALTPRF